MAPVGQIDLGPMDRAQAQSAGTDRELHRTRDGVVVGQGEGRISKRERGSDQFVRQRRAIQERERGVAVELDVRHEHMFVVEPDGNLVDKFLVSANFILVS